MFDFKMLAPKPAITLSIGDPQDAIEDTQTPMFVRSYPFERAMRFGPSIGEMRAKPKAYKGSKAAKMATDWRRKR